MKFEGLRVRDLMRTEVKTINKDAELAEAARMMYESRLASLVIKPEDDSDAFGILTRKDIFEALLLDGTGECSSRVEDMMSKPAITVTPGLSIENCLRLMRVAGARRLPVVEGTKLLGIITSTDIFDRIVSSKC
ncbi:MAG: CBS domain-containing protein [Desulfobacteraceae bacterium]|nr:CBS domain-containing protein [Desulfobacteraceae bacterium]